MTTALQMRIVDPPEPPIHILDAPMPPVHVFDDADIPPFPIPTTFKDADFTAAVTLTCAVIWVASSPATFSSVAFVQLLARAAHDWNIAPNVSLSVSAAQSERVSISPSVVLSVDAGPGNEVTASADVVLSATSKVTALVDAPFTASAAMSAAVVQLGGTTAAPAEFGATVAFTAEVMPAANVTAQYGAGVTLSATVKTTVSAPFTVSGSLAAPTVVPVSALFNGSGSLSVLAEIPTTYPATNIYPSEALFPSAQLRWARSANFTGGSALAMTAYESVSRTAAFTGGGTLSATVISTPLPARMNKTATQSLSGSTWTKVTGWSADGSYPSTVISDNSLLVAGSGTMVIHAQVTFAGPGTTANLKGCQVKVNGSVVATFSGTASSAVWGGTQSVTLNNGDLVVMEAYHGSATGSNRVVQESGTYLYYDIT